MRLLLVLAFVAGCDSSPICMRDHRGVNATDHRTCSLQFDAPIASGADEECFCNVLTQTGCNAGKKCTWIHDQVVPVLGHICCAPDGTRQLGETCTYGAAGANGYDDCVKGAACADGVCAAICDPHGGAPTCDPTHACAPHVRDFEIGGNYAAGVCAPTCDPLADNDFLGSGQRGSGCAAGQGCYGPFVGKFACAPEGNPSLVHRSACGSDCIAAPTLEGCAQGYVPLVADSTGSTQLDCIALCKPGNTYLGNPGTQYPIGQAPHACTSTDARGTFDTGSNGDQCFFSWALESAASPTGDTVGFCIDHSKYTYDSNANGMADGSDATWPPCTSLAIGSNTYDATWFGCVDTVTASANGHPPAAALQLRTDLRLPYVR